MNDRVHTLSTDAPPSEVYLALANATGLSAWLCTDGAIRAVAGGHALIANNDPALVYAGTVVDVETDSRIAYDLGRIDGEGRATVRAEITATDDGSELALTVGAEADDALAKLLEGRIRNLRALLETGYDLRISELPLIGVMPGPALAAEALRKRGIDADQGLSFLGTVPGLSAERAGLRAGDVLIKAAGRPLTRWGDFQDLVRERSVGDSLPLRYARDGALHDADLELLARPMPTLPTSAEQAAAAALAHKAPLDQELDALFVGVSDEEAAQKPAPDSWSANEVLAHLINAERDHQVLITSVLLSNRLRVFSNNHPARVAATTERYGSAGELLAALKASHAETVALYRHLPAEALGRRGALVFCLMIEEGGTFHTRHHVGQIRRAVAAAREAVAA